MEGFFQGVPEQPGVAFVVVTHLSPGRKSLLHEIVGRYTRMPVQVAADGAQVEPDHVYVLPADAILSIEGQRLVIRQPEPGRRHRKPIDIFFSALAVDQGESTVGVVLSGGDGDGTLGIKAIKERGGLTLAQVPDGHGPEHPAMPQTAISTGLVDFALPADQMGGRIVEFARSQRLLDHMATDSRRSRDGEAAKEARREIYAILRNQIGHDFAGYKTNTFLRRVQRRMQVSQLNSLDGYLEKLRQDPQEVGALFRDLLINVTSFFRDEDAFGRLADTVVPKLFEGRGTEDTVRVWVPGCATGEEVFSLGILLREEMDRLNAVPRVQIFATDIDDRALGVARAARYPGAMLEGVSDERRRRFFIPDNGSFLLSKEVRDLCIFSPHSVIRDPPFSRMDLISCRNLLIYFGAEVQSQVIPTFHYALRPDGFLFLGTSENISQFDELFSPLDKKQRIFRRRAGSGSGIRLPLSVHALRPGQVAGKPRRPGLSGLALRQSVEAQVLDRFAPAYVVVNHEGDVVYYSGRTGKYLEPAPGLPNRQLLAMARKGLRLELRTVFREALESGRTVTREGVAVDGDDGRVQMVTLFAEPLRERDEGEPLFLVLFADEGPTLSRAEVAGRSHALQDGATLHLEHELRETRERLQSLIEEYETALEELKSSNEELISVNEELQSTNEELEASKEELQSVNEELHTVNADLNNKVDALDRANTDLQNLFNSTDVATLFLDRDLRIRSFTPAASRVFNMLPGDRGRPITDLSQRFSLASFGQELGAVMASGQPVERRVDDGSGQVHYLLRMTPYLNSERRPEGVIVTVMDVTSLTRAEARQRLLVAELQHRTRNLLGVVQSVAQRTLNDDERMDTFQQRLATLGRVQSLIAHAAQRSIDLGEIVRAELHAFAVPADERIRVAGPPVPLNMEHVQIVALVLHELTTNAVKHGALVHPGGRLRVEWFIRAVPEGGRCLVLLWQENGVPITAPPNRSGYGRELIERALSYSLDARTELSFGPDGVRCVIEMPLAEAA
ncbi:CheR family methyltransferase [Teichococcus vastitatis]|uniref:CheR family methyltransferase n=1 Tax=Teichococcus vastitatis TaxID=2307076 RepID=UPI00240F8EDA|nr:CheR family methyltransferase [Pseudoroseomonas vastitatis]